MNVANTALLRTAIPKGLATMSLPRVRRHVETHRPSASPDGSAIRAFFVRQLMPNPFPAPS